MEERRTAAIVLCICALFAFVFFYLIPYVKHKFVQTLAFKDCSITYYYSDKLFPKDDVDRATQNKLALCLCKAYVRHPDTVYSKKIIEIYHKYGSAFKLDSANFSRYRFDSILKHKDIAFDTTIVVD